MFPLEFGDELVNAGEFGVEGRFNSRRPPVSVCYFGDVLASNTKLASNAAVNSGGELLSIDGGVHIFCKRRDKSSRGSVPPENQEYSRWNKLVKKKIAKVMLPEVSLGIGTRLRAIRKGRGLNQTQLAALLGVKQPTVVKWEKGVMKPSPAILLKISELVSEGSERQWWRDQAAKQAGFMEGAEVDVTGVTLPTASPFRIIPLIKNPLKIGDLGQMDVAEIQENLHLPNHWFSEGGTIRAVTIHNNPLSPLIAGDHIAIIDVSRRDADRLAGCVVAVRTVTGIDVRMLQKDRNVYFLKPLNEASGQSVRVLKHDGEDSIVGQVLKWIADAPSSEQAPRKTTKRT
ncbi:helix-turn-helix transcriptional regulator [Alloacidobacterium dinghuense]|uniref:Helix-turn-helix transcriptional regulator n=1 Tax=Alloacidobacterium dinghuense TaxID=2763107 RepID=A0A7G8BPP4_9BACT|nr:helix-turn-helix domain-containing protein [Alloacidobacterium dinghuense]QNI34514.1 helix-turn-helix transcriptional regulator [Alloacidobacterium dinghuense]